MKSRPHRSEGAVSVCVCRLKASEKMSARTHRYKIVLLGDPGVGKTTFFLRLRDSEFVDTEKRATVTLGVENLEYMYKIGDADIQVYLHDTGGGERFRTLTSNFYRNADAAILMYSVEDQYTFENLQEWVENAQVSVDPDNFVWALVGNKCDQPLEIEHDLISAKCTTIGTKLNFFTSAKTGENVRAAFEEIIKAIHEFATVKKFAPAPYSSGPNITKGRDVQPKRGCC